MHLTMIPLDSISKSAFLTPFLNQNSCFLNFCWKAEFFMGGCCFSWLRMGSSYAAAKFCRAIPCVVNPRNNSSANGTCSYHWMEVKWQRIFLHQDDIFANSLFYKEKQKWFLFLSGKQALGTLEKTSITFFQRANLSWIREVFSHAYNLNIWTPTWPSSSKCQWYVMGLLRTVFEKQIKTSGGRIKKTQTLTTFKANPTVFS